MYSVVLMMALTTGGEVSDFGKKGGCGGCSGCYGGGGGLFHGRRHGCHGGCSGCYGGGGYGGGYGGCYGGGYGGGYGGCYGGMPAPMPYPQPQPQPTLNPQPLPPGHAQAQIPMGGCSGGFAGHGQPGQHPPHGMVVGGGCSGGFAGHPGPGHPGPGHPGPGHPGHHGCQGGHPHHGLVVGGSCFGGIILSITPSTDKKDEKKDKKDRKDRKDQEESDQISEGTAKVVVSLPAEAKLKIDGQETKATGSERTFVTPKLANGDKYSWTLEVELMHEGKPVAWSQKVALTPGETHRVSLTMPVSLKTK